jgi:hypothetical protein
MQSPVLVSRPHQIHSPEFIHPSLIVQSGPMHQSPKVHLSPLMSTVRVTPSEQKHSALVAKAQPYAATTTAVQHQSPQTMFVQSVEHMAPAVRLFTPPIPTSTLAPTIFPPEDINKKYTTASYSEESIPELVNSDKGHWTFSLDVPIPDKMVFPILTSLEYTVKYGTGNGHDTSTIQTSILLTKIPDASSYANSTLIPNGFTTDAPNISIYWTGAGFPPQVLDGVPVVCLSSIPAVRENCRASQSEHYIDKQQLLPHVRIVEDSHLYLQLHVAETPSPLMLRSLTVNVAATWVEDMQGKAMQDNINTTETRSRVAEQQRAGEEQARLQAERKSAEAKQAEEAAVQLEKAAKKKSEDDQLAKQRADRQADTDRLEQKRADDLAETHVHATEAADAAAQCHRKDKQDADQKAVADHQAEVAAEARAQGDREARSAIECQL